MNAECVSTLKKKFNKKESSTFGSLYVLMARWHHLTAAVLKRNNSNWQPAREKYFVFVYIARYGWWNVVWKFIDNSVARTKQKSSNTNNAAKIEVRCGKQNTHTFVVYYIFYLFIEPQLKLAFIFMCHNFGCQPIFILVLLLNLTNSVLIRKCSLYSISCLLTEINK